MAFSRGDMDERNVLPAAELKTVRPGLVVRVAGAVIVRQRPGTAKGFFFLSLEDETGIANVIVHPELFDKYRHILLRQSFLLVRGILQNQQNAVSIKAIQVEALNVNSVPVPSHDFH